MYVPCTVQYSIPSTAEKNAEYPQRGTEVQNNNQINNYQVELSLTLSNVGPSVAMYRPGPPSQPRTRTRTKKEKEKLKQNNLYGVSYNGLPFTEYGWMIMICGLGAWPSASLCIIIIGIMCTNSSLRSNFFLSTPYLSSYLFKLIDPRIRRLLSGPLLKQPDWKRKEKKIAGHMKEGKRNG